MIHVCVHVHTHTHLQTAKKLVEYYSKLRELGHPEYLGAGTVVMYTLKCSSTQDEADDMVCHACKLCTLIFVTYTLPVQCVCDEY